MIPLTLLIFVFLGATLAGSGMIAALTMGYTTGQPLLVAAAIGFLIAVPVSWMIAKRLKEQQGG